MALILWDPVPFFSPLYRLELINSQLMRPSASSLPPSDSRHQIHPKPLHLGPLSMLPPNDENKASFCGFSKGAFFFFRLWKNFENCFGGWHGVFLNRYCIVFQERVGFVYLETTLTLVTRGYLLSILSMLFLTHGESAWWPRNMREPQESCWEQPSLLWFSFFIMFDIFEAELFKKYRF